MMLFNTRNKDCLQRLWTKLSFPHIINVCKVFKESKIIDCLENILQHLQSVSGLADKQYLAYNFYLGNTVDMFLKVTSSGIKHKYIKNTMFKPLPQWNSLE